MLAVSFIFITYLALCFFYSGTGKNKQVLVISFLWITVVSLISVTGYFEDTTARPPRFLLVIIPGIGLSFWFYKKLKTTHLKQEFLLAVHLLRLPVELVLYQLFLNKQIPVLMTFRGWNFDILMGITAIFLLLYLIITRKNPARPFFIVWNIAGIFLLTTIVLIAILSSPLPIQLIGFDQPNIALLKFPFALLPAYIVPIVFLSHVLTLRNLLEKTD
ncbi:hypothetical protein [Fluviicola sp.]|uniref:hypothetical protein n=1 Tax=Fluviicola sp. TaxID=1917219 RepID=UPI00261FFEAB|nr:hypothetical protein [Fluviicola sp.]